MRLAPAIWILLLAVPAARACSIHGPESEGPGVFDIRDLQGNPMGQVEVDARELGGDCSLSNPAWLGEADFAWMEGRLLHYIGRQGTFTLFMPEDVQRLAGDGFQIVARSNESYYRVNILTATVGPRIDIPSGWHGLEMAGHAVQLVDENHALRAYDLQAQDWVGPSITERYRGLFGQYWMTLETADGTLRIVSTQSGEDHHTNDVVGRPIALDENILWSRNGTEPILHSVDLITGKTTAVQTAFPTYYGPIAGNRILQRIYSKGQFEEPVIVEAAVPTNPDQAAMPWESGSDDIPSEPKETPSPLLGTTAIALTAAVFISRARSSTRGK